MSVHNYRENANGFYFITFTNYKWLQLFHNLDMYDEIYKWFNILEEKKESITGFVIMPNHMHLLLFHNEKNGVLEKIIANGKRFMSYEMIKRLKEKKDWATLKILTDELTEAEKKKGQKHKTFEESFDCKRCFTEKFIQQKLNYMHNNPIQEKWKLADTPQNYKHSSAAFYGEQPMMYSFNLQHYKSVEWKLEDANTDENE